MFTLYCFILNFFRTNLSDWANQNEKIYSYPARGDEGIEVARYKSIDEFSTQNEIVEYIKEAIVKFHDLYPKIIENADLFEDIVRAAPKWDEFSKFSQIYTNYITTILF